MRIDPNKIRELKQAVDIAALVGRHVKLKPSGALLKGLCPFHSEKTPSFYVYPDKGTYVCYGCGEHGDVIDFVMKTEGLTFSEAARKLAQEAGIRLEALRPEEEARHRQAQMHERRLLDTNEIALGFFRNSFASAHGAEARQYVSRRGISPEMAEAFELGYAPDSWDALVQELSRRGLTAFAAELGLIRQRREGPGYYSFFRNRLVFPIRDHQRRLVGFGARLLDPEAKEAKYVNSPESRLFHKNSTLYGLHLALRSIRRQERAMVVEGNVDVIQLHQHGFTESVAPLGTAFTRNHAALLRRYTEQIVMIFDGDDAGRRATIKSVPLALEAGLRVKVLLLPQGHDPDSFLREQGAEALSDLMNRAMDGVEAFMELTLPSRNAPVSDRFAAVTRLLPVLDPLHPQVRDIYLEQTAVMLDLPVEAVRRAYTEAPRQGGISAANGASPTPAVKSGRKHSYTREEVSELRLLLYLMALYDSFPYLYDPPHETDVLSMLHTDAARTLWHMFLESELSRTEAEYENSENQALEPSTEWKELLGNLYSRFTEYKNTALETLPEDRIREKAFEDTIYALEANHLRAVARELEARMAVARRTGNTEELDELLDEKLELERRRIELSKQRKG